MKEQLVKKIIEAGLVPKHALEMMRRWRLVDPDLDVRVPTKDELEMRTREQLTAFAEEIGALLEAKTDMPELMETDLQLEQLFREQSQPASVTLEMGPQRVHIDGLVSVQTRDGRIVLRRTGAEKYIEHLARPGSKITLKGEDYEVMDVEVRYVRETPEFYSCGVRKLDAQV